MSEQREELLREAEALIGVLPDSGGTFIVEGQRIVRELIDEVTRLRAALREVVTNGEWQGGTDWRISTAVYEMANDAFAAAESLS